MTSNGPMLALIVSSIVATQAMIGDTQGAGKSYEPPPEEPWFQAEPETAAPTEPVWGPFSALYARIDGTVPSAPEARQPVVLPCGLALDATLAPCGAIGQTACASVEVGTVAGAPNRPVRFFVDREPGPQDQSHALPDASIRSSRGAAGGVPDGS